MENERKAAPGAISGHLEAYNDGPVTEGLTFWTVAEQGKPDLAGLSPIREGDLLTVYNENFSETLWKGRIDYDYARNPVPMPNMSQVLVQRIGDTIVSGIPKGIDPETWLSYFRDRRPCTLERVPV